MKRQAIFTVLWVAPIAILCGCAEDTGGEWTTEVWPESTVQANYCTEMPHDNLEAPEVVREGEDTWAINYPVFRDGCGAYQLTGDVQFFPDRGGESYYAYDVTVCNRCERVHAVYSLDGLVDTGTDEPRDSLKRLPESPAVKTSDSFERDAAPVVEHADENSTLKENPPCNGSRTGNVTQVIPDDYAISYEEINRFRVDPDEPVSKKTTGSRYNYTGVQLLELEKETFDSTRLRWPRVLPLEGPVDGRVAASRLEYCAVYRDGGAYVGNDSVRRAYEFPYKADQKYVTQTVTPPTLPDELVKRLEEGAEK